MYSTAVDGNQNTLNMKGFLLLFIYKKNEHRGPIIAILHHWAHQQTVLEMAL